jgi:hypothetical protein
VFFFTPGVPINPGLRRHQLFNVTFAFINASTLMVFISTPASNMSRLSARHVYAVG